jgi:hypothetical protein
MAPTPPMPELPAHAKDVAAVGYGPNDDPVVPAKYAELPVFHEDSGKKDSWNANLNNPKASSVYVVDKRYIFVTDEHARLKHVEGWLGRLPSKENAERRNEYAQRQAGVPDRLPGDNGGHAVPTQFRGPGEKINLTAQAGDQNLAVRGDKSNWRKMEQAWHAMRKSGIQVHASIDIAYPARPDDGSDRAALRPSQRTAVHRTEGRRSPRQVYSDNRRRTGRES